MKDSAKLYRVKSSWISTKMHWFSESVDNHRNIIIVSTCTIKFVQKVYGDIFPSPFRDKNPICDFPLNVANFSCFLKLEMKVLEPT